MLLLLSLVLASYDSVLKTLSINTDIINDKYRLKSPNKRCEMKQTFQFSLEDLINNQNSNLPLTNGTLRVYIQPIKRLLSKNKAIDIQITVTARVSAKGIKSGVVIAHTEKIAATPNMTAQWKEWNITNAMLDCWQNKTNNTLLEVTINFKRLKCIRGQKKIPLIVVDLATFPLNQTTRRERHWPLQPMVVLFLDDETERKKLRGDISVQHNSPVFSTEETQSVSKRSTTASCKLVNFTVNFAEIRLHNIVYPTTYNAKQCKGDCSHSYMDKNDATNHARILASYDYHYKTYNWQLKVIPRVPSCVAGGYSPLSVIEIARDKTISVKYYPEMIATRCECRA